MWLKTEFGNQDKPSILESPILPHLLIKKLLSHYVQSSTNSVPFLEYPLIIARGPLISPCTPNVPFLRENRPQQRLGFHTSANRIASLIFPAPFRSRSIFASYFRLPRIAPRSHPLAACHPARAAYDTAARNGII